MEGGEGEGEGERKVKDKKVCTCNDVARLNESDSVVCRSSVCFAS